MPAPMKVGAGMRLFPTKAPEWLEAPHRTPARYLGAKCLFIDEVQNVAAVVLKNQR